MNAHEKPEHKRFVIHIGRHRLEVDEDPDLVASGGHLPLPGRPIR
jgi:hypothetical protein